jgi:tRNA pseudouridine32 synthase/23S rRNA pseudouridine746 synthase
MLMRGLCEPQAGADEHLVVYGDDHLLVLEKPAGMLCVPGRGPDKQDCLSTRIQRLQPDALVVHRLDMATSGLCLMARGPIMQRVLSQVFAQRQVSKRYLAVVAGDLATAAGAREWALIDMPIAADWPNRPRRVIDPERGKPSQTRWRLMPEAPGETWPDARARVELEPVTGRTHQLRVHLAAIGYPILGDALYAPAQVQALSSRLLLHASELRFTHPASGRPMAFTSPAPF